MDAVKCKITVPSDFPKILNYFSEDKCVKYVHGAVDRVHDHSSQGLWSQVNEDRPIPDMRRRLKDEGVRFLGCQGHDGQLRFYERRVYPGLLFLWWMAMIKTSEQVSSF
jgi:hypothetical protein